MYSGTSPDDTMYLIEVNSLYKTEIYTYFAVFNVGIFTYLLSVKLLILIRKTLKTPLIMSSGEVPAHGYTPKVRRPYGSRRQDLEEKTMKKYSWIVALLMALAMALIGCGGGGGDDDDDGTGPGGEPPVDYTVVQEGGETGVTDSAKIKFTFEKAVEGLTASNITISDGTGAAFDGDLTGSGTAWEMAIGVAKEGDVKVKIKKDGIVADEKTVAIFKGPWQYTIDKTTGQVKIYFKDFDFEPEEDVNYNVTLAFSAFDTELAGCHMAGQVYVDGSSTEWVGWGNFNPDTIKGSPEEYTYQILGFPNITDSGDVYLQLTFQKSWTSGDIVTEEYGFNATITTSEFEIPPLLGNLGAITSVNSASQQGWETGSGGLEWSTVSAAKYLVIKATDLPNAGGVGGVQLIIANAQVSYWAQENIVDSGWLDFPTAAADVTYIVIDLTAHNKWTDFITGSSGKILIGEIQHFGTLLGAWILPAATTLTKPTTAVDLAGSFGYLAPGADWENDLEGDE